MDVKKLIAMGMLGGGLGNLSLDFASGASADRLIGSTWTTDGTKLINTPSLGGELWDAPAAVFTSGTYAWAAQGTNTLANVSNTLEITFVNNAGGAIEYFSNAADLSSDLTVGQFYRLQFDAKVNGGSASFRVYNGEATYTKGLVTNTDFAQRVTTLKANHATLCYIINGLLDGTEKFYFDNLSLKQTTFKTNIAAALFRSAYGITKAAWTTSNGVICGVCMNIDSMTDPKNGVFAVIDYNVADFYKLVNGTWTRLASTSYTYSTGGVVEIRHLSGDTFGLYYNNAQIGTDQTITGMTGKYHGLFSTDPTAQCANFFFHALVTDPINVLMLGDSKTVGFGDVYNRLYKPPYEFEEVPTRIATSGWTAANMAAGIDAALASATGTPAYILVNLGANDTVSLPAEATWKTNTNYYIDALNVKYPGVPIYMMRVWKRGELDDCNTIAGWINDIVAGNASVHLGPDERVFLEGGDDGATYTSDGTHPNDAGYALEGRQWLTAIGY